MKRAADQIARLRDLCASEPVPARLKSVSIVGEAIGAQRSVVVIPARNEASRIARCLEALACLAGRTTQNALIILVANNCEDDTVQIACATARRRPMTLVVLDTVFQGRGSVGLARRIGFSAARIFQPDVEIMLTTDADCQVFSNWYERSLHHLRFAGAVCGRVVLDPAEAMTLSAQALRVDALERAYFELTLEFQSLLRPDPFNPWPHHGQAPGASLGFRREAYHAVRGFATMVAARIATSFAVSGPRADRLSVRTIFVSWRRAGSTVGLRAAWPTRSRAA